MGDQKPNSTWAFVSLVGGIPGGPGSLIAPPFGSAVPTERPYSAPFPLVQRGGGLGGLSSGDRVQDSPERLCRCRKGQLVEDQTLAAG